MAKKDAMMNHLRAFAFWIRGAAKVGVANRVNWKIGSRRPAKNIGAPRAK